MWVLAGIPGCIQTCGSELARDEGITFNIDVGRTIAIASKLAPTVDSCVQFRGLALVAENYL
ncbi:hypothetical protein D3C84_1251350 [compost metagenome]